MTRCKLIRSLLVVWVLLFVRLSADLSTTRSELEYIPNTTLVIPMRDGTPLPTDIYLPKDLSQRYPVILIRNPSGRKAMPWLKFADLTKSGYIVAFQDTRSSLDVEGKTMPYLADGWGDVKDGYDAVEALAKYEYSNGKIGTAGYSATGITQLMMAPSAPPSLCAQHIGVAASNLYHHAIYPGGCLLKNQVEGWLGLYAKDPSMTEIVLREPFYNSFWNRFNVLNESEKVQAPGLLYGGWYDTFLQGTIDAFVSRQDSAAENIRDKHKLIIGPWTHSWPRHTRLGDFDIPDPGKNPPWDMSPLAWFDYHLKGKSTGIENAPSVTYYVMGPFDGSPSKGNRWKTASHWPILSKAEPYYLADNGLLLKGTAPAQQLQHTYTIDSENPVPTLGGANLFLEPGPKDQRAVEARDDVLVFTTEPLDRDTEITGYLKAKLYYSAPNNEADIMVRLCDVYPDGRSILISDGAYHIAKNVPGVRRGTEDQPQLAEIDLWSTSIVIAKGHSIRVSVSGSNYPRFEKPSSITNVQLGAKSLPSVTFLTGGSTPSHIVLPIVE